MAPNHNNQMSLRSRAWKSQGFKETLFWVAIFLTMILGMIAKSVYDNVQRNIAIEINWGILATREVFLPILISPIVFGGIYGLISGSPKNVETFMFSFQNGFFWKTIFSQAEQDAYIP